MGVGIQALSYNLSDPGQLQLPLLRTEGKKGGKGLTDLHHVGGTGTAPATSVSLSPA